MAKIHQLVVELIIEATWVQTFKVSSDADSESLKRLGFQLQLAAAELENAIDSIDGWRIATGFLLRKLKWYCNCQRNPCKCDTTRLVDLCQEKQLGSLLTSPDARSRLCQVAPGRSRARPSSRWHKYWKTGSDTYSNPQIDAKVNHHQITRDFLVHLFGDEYNFQQFDLSHGNQPKHALKAAKPRKMSAFQDFICKSHIWNFRNTKGWWSRKPMGWSKNIRKKG